MSAHEQVPIETYTFENGPTCRGDGAIYEDKNGQYSVDFISIEGEYPKIGEWARNRGSDEVVRILRGTGFLALRSTGTGGAIFVELSSSHEKIQEITVPKDAWFAWHGNGLDIEMRCQPPFSQETYQVVASGEIEAIEKKELTEALILLAEVITPKDVELYRTYDNEDLMGALYGILLDNGEDPDAVFAEYGITNKKENER